MGLRPDVANVLAAADVFALPSLEEGLPLALLEAMLASRPIVASNVGEIGAVLANGKAGLLVEPRDSAGLAAALNQLLADPARGHAMATLAAERARADYTLEQMTSRYEALYQQLLGRPRLKGPRVTAGAA